MTRRSGSLVGLLNPWEPVGVQHARFTVTGNVIHNPPSDRIIIDTLPPARPPVQIGMQWNMEHDCVETITMTGEHIIGQPQTMKTERWQREADLHRVQFSAFCQQWIAIAWSMLIGTEKP